MLCWWNWIWYQEFYYSITVKSQTHFYKKQKNFANNLKFSLKGNMKLTTIFGIPVGLAEPYKGHPAIEQK